MIDQVLENFAVNDFLIVTNKSDARSHI